MKSGCPKCGQKMINRVHFKTVRNIDTGEIFESIKAAGESRGINLTCIGNVCRGKQKKRVDIFGSITKTNSRNFVADDMANLKSLY